MNTITHFGPNHPAAVRCRDCAHCPVRPSKICGVTHRQLIGLGYWRKCSAYSPAPLPEAKPEQGPVLVPLASAAVPWPLPERLADHLALGTAAVITENSFTGREGRMQFRALMGTGIDVMLSWPDGSRCAVANGGRRLTREQGLTAYALARAALEHSARALADTRPRGRA